MNVLNIKKKFILLCSKLINSCIVASHETIPMKRHIGKDVPGWDELVKPERDRSLFWHWMWQEAGKPQTGIVYGIMKRTRHQYHYAVQCCKKQKLEVQKQKLAENISHSTRFWNEINKLNPSSKTMSNSIDDANGSKEISNLFYEKYRRLYNSVPTNATELDDLHHTKVMGYCLQMMFL